MKKKRVRGRWGKGNNCGNNIFRTQELELICFVRNHGSESGAAPSSDILNCQNVPLGTGGGGSCICVIHLCVWFNNRSVSQFFREKKSLKCSRVRQSTSATVAMRQSKLVNSLLREQYNLFNNFPIVFLKAVTLWARIQRAIYFTASMHHWLQTVESQFVRAKIETVAYRLAQSMVDWMSCSLSHTTCCV